MISGAYASGTDGKIGPYAPYQVSAPIPVTAGEKLTISSKQPSANADTFINVAYYDKDMNFLGRVSAQDRGLASLTITVRKDAAFIRLNVNGKADQYERMITKGTELLEYQEYRSGGTPELVEGVNTEVKPEPQPEPPKQVFVNVEDFATPQDAVDHVAKLGGGIVKFNTADTSGEIVISTDGITLFSEVPDAILRPVGKAGNPSTLAVVKGGTNFVLDGLDVRGQKLSYHGMSNEKVVDGVVTNIVNATALSSISIQETGATLRNFKCQYTGLDSLNVNYVGDVNLTVDNYFIGTCGRNPFSLIQGENVTFTNGEFYIDNTCTGNRDGLSSGLYLHDIEPNSELQLWRGIKYKNVVFTNNGTGYANNQVIFQDASATQLNDMDVHMENVSFRGLNGKKSAIIRIKLDNESKTFSNFHLKDVTCEGRCLTMSDKVEYLLLNGTFENITIGEVSLTYNIRLGKDCVVDNLKNVNGAEVYVRHNKSEAVVANTQLHPKS